MVIGVDVKLMLLFLVGFSITVPILNILFKIIPLLRPILRKEKYSKSFENEC